MKNETYASKLNRESYALRDVPIITGPQYGGASIHTAEESGYWHRHLGIVCSIHGECFDCKNPLLAGSHAIYDDYINRVFCLDCAPRNEFSPELTPEQEQALAAGLAGMVALATAPHKRE